MSPAGPRWKSPGPGFINVTFDEGFLAQQLDHVGDTTIDSECGWRRRPRRVVVDYSAPNIAKEMHIGHLRTTVIGDTLVRILEFVGHTVSARTTSATGAHRSAC